jgi:hypothetical protein
MKGSIRNFPDINTSFIFRYDGICDQVTPDRHANPSFITFDRAMRDFQVANNASTDADGAGAAAPLPEWEGQSTREIGQPQG